MLSDTLELALTFDDVLLVPQASSVLPKETNLATRLTPEIKLAIPLVSAAMDTVTESKMAIAMARGGGIGIIHKNMSIDEQSDQVHKVKKESLIVGAAIGVTQKEIERATSLINAGVDVVCVDTAHGHSMSVVEMVALLRKKYKKLPIVAGNIATAEAACSLIEAGASALKVGVGPGSICTTRIVCGCGIPQISAIAEVAKISRKAKVPIIADGGIKHSGDVVKAIAAGAETVMLGSLFAGTDEAPGDVMLFHGRSFKVYRGMGSVSAMQRGSKERYFQSDVEDVTKFVPEGVEGRVPYRGSLQDVIYHLVGGLKGGMGYVGAKTINDLITKSKFVRITKAGLLESHVHDVTITKEAPNYSMEF